MEIKFTTEFAILICVIESILFAFAKRFETINDRGQTIDRWTEKIS